MTTWEYLYEQITESERVLHASEAGRTDLSYYEHIERDNPTEVLNRRGAEGWELVGFTTVLAAGSQFHYCTYKRPKVLPPGAEGNE